MNRWGKKSVCFSTRGFKQANVIPFCFTRDIIPAAPLLINVTTINQHSRGWDKYLRRGYLSLSAGLFACKFRSYSVWNRLSFFFSLFSFFLFFPSIVFSPTRTHVDANDASIKRERNWHTLSTRTIFVTLTHRSGKKCLINHWTIVRHPFRNNI